MAKADFYPKNQAPLLQWLQLQLQQWPEKGAAFGYDAGQIGQITDRIQAVLTQAARVSKLQAGVGEEIGKRDQLAADFEAYYRDLIQRAKRTPGLEAGLTDAFKWNGTEKTPPDPATTRPTISNVHTLPGEVEVDWVRAGFDGVDVELSYDGQTWTRGDFDNRSPYEDRRPTRTPGQPETRYYRLRYRYQGEPFGQYSATAQATVTG